MAKPDQVSDETLRELLVQAQAEMRNNKPTDAVHTLVKALFRLLEIKPELVTEKLEPRPGWKMSFLTRWPQLGANWRKGSLESEKPEIEFVRERFALSEAITYFEFLIETSIKRNA